MSDIAEIQISGNRACKIAETEQSCVINAILDHAVFKPVIKVEETTFKGPYSVQINLQDHRLVIETMCSNDNALPTLILSLKPYKRIITDYFMMIESYEMARQTSTREKLEAIDMARRGIHNDGADLLISRLKDKIELDFETARNFFSLICFLKKQHPLA